jgi:hypothetical protein
MYRVEENEEEGGAEEEEGEEEGGGGAQQPPPLSYALQKGAVVVGLFFKEKNQLIFLTSKMTRTHARCGSSNMLVLLLHAVLVICSYCMRY